MSWVRGKQNPARIYDDFDKTGCNSVKETGERCGAKKGYYSVSGPQFSVWCCSNCNIETTIFESEEKMKKVCGEGLGPQSDGTIKIKLKK